MSSGHCAGLRVSSDSVWNTNPLTSSIRIGPSMAGDQINMYALSWGHTQRLQRRTHLIPEQVKSQGAGVGLYQRMGMDESVYTDLGGSFAAWCVSTHQNTLKYSRIKMEKWACANTRTLHTQKGKYISMCLCHMTLPAYQSSLQWKAAVESVAMKSRHDPQIVGANMKALSYQGESEREGGGVVL